ncbi:hypothetical protein BU17DRAFT_48961 [Hysterangium stoloniferum]|nr:hypothetical protein BU17DRAFT_48961 [Hysterangium stoloniferum]
MGSSRLYFRVYFTIPLTHPNATDEDESHPNTKILESIEKQWLKLDQDLFIACFFLNPFINPSLHNPNNLTVAILMGIIH